MRLPLERGPLSARLIGALRGVCDLSGSFPGAAVGPSVFDDADLQLTLWMLYELHYRGFDEVGEDREWDPDLIRLRVGLEARFETALKAATLSSLTGVDDVGNFEDQLLAFVAAADGPSVASYLHREASREQVLSFLRARSVYHLKESDPHAFVLSRLDGPAKAALSELLYDEYGGGRSDRLHATLYGDALEACGLDRSYGAYIEDASALTLAVNNLMSLFGLNRRLRAAAMGHLAAFEASSSVPCRKIAAGIERVGLPDAVAAYFHEHVEADAVHEQVAARDICGSLVAHEPRLRSDVLFGAAACLHLDDLAGREQLRAWKNEVAA